ncbi:MAG TPA: hypothetical protein PK876_07515, partial [Elusimicrobiota bacterium]|nr:hypothetical protein [Elusimicrobiota bacterium]
GKKLVYSAETISPDTAYPQRDLRLLDWNTLSSATLTRLPQNETEPSFSPDGQSIYFVSDQDHVFNLYRLDISSGRIDQLTKTLGGLFTPVLSPDGKRCSFVAFRNGEKHIYEGPLPLVSGKNSALSFSADPSGISFLRDDRSSSPPAAPPAGPRRAGLPLNPFHPYRFRASTDLFFPLLYYSSTDGLFLASYWQASEHLGNHEIAALAQYLSGDKFFDYQLQYSYKRFRPQFTLATQGLNYYRDFEETELQKESQQFAGVSYPLDRFQRIEGLASTLFRRNEFRYDSDFNYEERENYGAASYVRDTTTGRYLAVTSGTRFRATYQTARPVLGGDLEYKTHVLEQHVFVPTGRESTFALRALGGVSTGPNPQTYRLGGIDRLRGYSRRSDDNRASRFLMSNVEWRVPLTYLNYDTWFIFPDFFFKALYGTLFVDTGYDWDQSSDLNHLRSGDLMNSVGAGIRLPIFIMQTYPITVSFDVAKRTDAHRWVWYLSLGPEF